MAMIREDDQRVRDKYLVCDRCKFKDTICKYTESVDTWIVKTMQEIKEDPMLLPLESYFDCEYMEAKGWEGGSQSDEGTA